MSEGKDKHMKKNYDSAKYWIQFKEKEYNATPKRQANEKTWFNSIKGMNDDRTPTLEKQW